MTSTPTTETADPATRELHVWSVMRYYLRGTPSELYATDTVDLERQIREIAATGLRTPGTIEVDDFGDEVHTYLRRGKNRVAFMWCQYEGPKK